MERLVEVIIGVNSKNCAANEKQTRENIRGSKSKRFFQAFVFDIESKAHSFKGE